MAYKYRLANTIYKREWMRDRRANFLADKKCVVCGQKKNLIIDWGKNRQKDGHKINWSANPYRLEEVLKDAKIYCRKHFDEEVRKKRKTELVHGTLKGYKTHRCRCRPCTDASSLYSRRYRARKKKEMQTKLDAALKCQGIPRHIFDRL